jgi:hypothetical protein
MSTRALKPLCQLKRRQQTIEGEQHDAANAIQSLVCAMILQCILAASKYSNGTKAWGFGICELEYDTHLIQ